MESNKLTKIKSSFTIIYLSCIIMMILCIIPCTSASPINITPSEDTRAYNFEPDTNFGDSTSYYIRYDSEGESYAYFKFHTDNFSNNSMFFIKTSSYVAAGGYRLHLTSCEWNESIMTWNSGRPALEYTEYINATTFDAGNTWYSFDVSSTVNKPGTYSFALKPNYGKECVVISSNNETDKPYLQITPYDFVDIFSNNKTNDDSSSFLVNQSDVINFSISPPDITNVSSYNWSVNKVDQSNNASSFDFTVPQCDLSQPSTGIWEIRTIITYQNSSKIYQEWLISSLSELDAPDFIEYFHDNDNTNRGYYKDPWGRDLALYNQQDNYISKGLLSNCDSGSGDYLTTNFDVTYGTFKFKINNPSVLNIASFQVYGSSEGKASRWCSEWTGNEFHDYFCIVNKDGYIPISRRWLGQAPSVHWWKVDGWHEVTVIHEKNGLWSIWDDGALLPQTFGHYNNAFDNAYLLELIANSNLEMDCIEVYENKYIYPNKAISYGWYPKWWYLSDISNDIFSPVNDTGINVFGRDVTLKDIADTVNNETLFTYNDSTRTGISNVDICIRAGASLFISNETLIFNTSSDELDFSIKNGATLNITDSTISATNSPMKWNFVSSVSQTVFEPDVTRYNTAISGTPAGAPFNDFYGRLIIENSIINNTGNLFLDGAEEIIINNTIFRNHHAIDYGDYTMKPADFVNHNNKKLQSIGTKALWIVPRLDLNNFIVNNISFETPQTDIDIKVVGGQWIQNTTTIKNSDLSNINISTKKAHKYQYFIFYRQTDENSSVSLLNCLFNNSKLSVDTERSKLMVKYYVDVLVNDENGNPINNAMIFINNDNSSHNDYEPQVPYEYMDYIRDYYGPGVGGAANFLGISDAQYEQYSGGTYKRWYNALPLDYSTTNSIGHTPLPHEDANQSIILTDFVLTKPFENQIRTNFTYTIAVETPDSETFSLPNIDPDSYWQRENPSSPEYTIVAIIPNESTTPSLTGYAPYEENPITPSNTIMFQTWTNQPMTTNTWKLDGVTVETDSQSWLWENIPEGAHTVVYEGSNTNGTVSQNWDINGGSTQEELSITEIDPIDTTPDQNNGSTYNYTVAVSEPLTSSGWYLDGVQINSSTQSIQHTWTHASTHNITFTGSNDNGSVSQTWIVNVNDGNNAPVFVPVDSKSVDEGNTLSFTISATDADGDSLTYSATGLPTGASFNPDIRTFSWTPDENQVSSYQVHFEVTDGSLSDAEDVTITVTESSTAPSLVSVLPSSVQVTPAASFTLTIPITPATPITGAQFDLLFDNSLATVTSVTEGNLLNQDGATTLFNSGTINNAAGTVTSVYGSILGNTSVSSQGSLATISMTAGSTTGYLNLNLANIIISDANSAAVPYTLTNATVLIDTAPVLTQIGAKSVDEGSALALTLSATDADGDSLTYSATNLPAGASFNTATGAFSWTPADGQDGIYVVTFEVTDSYLSDSETVTITVNDANHAPIITTFVPENSLTYNELDVITIGIIANDADGQALSYTIKIDGVTKSTSSSYAWETDYSSAGTHTIDITVSDGIEQVTDQRTITINDVHPRWDVNEDGTVNVLDISIIGQKYGKSVGAPYPRWDVNQDGDVNVQDMTLAAYYFGETVA